MIHTIYMRASFLFIHFNEKHACYEIRLMLRNLDDVRLIKLLNVSVFRLADGGENGWRFHILLDALWLLD
jgi:hypothetical protein